MDLSAERAPLLKNKQTKQFTIPLVLQFYSKPPQQQDREHCSPPEPPHEVKCLHQELVPQWVLGSGGTGAALLSLLIRGIL